MLLRDRVPIALSPKVFDRLLFLIEHADRLLAKEEMLRGHHAHSVRDAPFQFVLFAQPALWVLL